MNSPIENVDASTVPQDSEVRPLETGDPLLEDNYHFDESGCSSRVKNHPNCKTSQCEALGVPCLNPDLLVEHGLVCNDAEMELV